MRKANPRSPRWGQLGGSFGGSHCWGGFGLGDSRGLGGLPGSLHASYRGLDGGPDILF